jgi:invasion protein IalB
MTRVSFWRRHNKPEAPVRSPRIGFFAAIGIVSLAAALATMPAHAQQQQDPLRAKGDKACNGDAKKICSKFFGQGDMVMLSCFQQNAKRLSRSCRSFLVEVGQLQN